MNSYGRQSLEMRTLVFLWNWKLATTATLSFKFFREIKEKSAYQRLTRMRRRGLIKMIPDNEGRNFFWTLTKKGYNAVRPNLPALAQEGFKTEAVEHDHLVSCFHIGEWLDGLPDRVNVFTEQQLRRYELSNYPDWIPTDTSHRPDGYTRIREDVIAIEFERSLKKEGDYYSVGKFYERNAGIANVLWLVAGASVAKRILKYFNAAQLSGVEKHGFVYLPQFLSKGWAAPLNFGAKDGLSLASVLEENVKKMRRNFFTPLLLDTRKCPLKSVGYREISSNPNPV